MHCLFPGNAEQGQLGRVSQCFSNRGGRKGLSKLSIFTGADKCNEIYENVTPHAIGWSINNCVV